VKTVVATGPIDKLSLTAGTPRERFFCEHMCPDARAGCFFWTFAFVSAGVGENTFTKKRVPDVWLGYLVGRR
jgi:hypothetical protein